jgi:two-component system, response regulator PdtaR
MFMVFDSNTYSTLVVSSSEKGLDFIGGLLSMDLFYPVVTSRSASEAKRTLIETAFDIVIVNTPLTDQYGTEFAVDISQDIDTSVLMLVKSEHYEEISSKMNELGILTLSKPTTKQMVYQAVRLLCATKQRLGKLEKKNETLKEKMDEIRIVNRAKWTLIEYLKMSESEAHRYIEKQAMDMRITKRKAAERIIKTYEN